VVDREDPGSYDLGVVGAFVEPEPRMAATSGLTRVLALMCTNCGPNGMPRLTVGWR